MGGIKYLPEMSETQFSGNSGEWAEPYTFLKLLYLKRLVIFDSESYFEIKEINRPDDNRIYRYSDKENFIDIIEENSGKILKTVPLKTFQTIADKIFNELIKPKKNKKESISEDTNSKSKKDISAMDTKNAKKEKKGIQIPEADKFLREIGFTKLRQSSNKKADILLTVYDLRLKIYHILGFDIKSHLKSDPSIVNATTSGGFIYRISNISFKDKGLKDIITEINNELNKKNLKYYNLISKIKSLGGKISFHCVENPIFEANLNLVCENLPQILAKCVFYHYSKETSNNFNAMIKEFNQNNPLDFKLDGLPYYEYKIKRYLTESLYGMTIANMWNGCAKLTNGLIFVEKDGVPVAKLFENLEEMQNYLIDHSYIDTPSSSKHGFGKVYQDKNYPENLFLKFNFQVRLHPKKPVKNDNEKDKDDLGEDNIEEENDEQETDD